MIGPDGALEDGSFTEVINETDPNAVTITRTLDSGTYVQTITISGTTTTISQWVKQ